MSGSQLFVVFSALISAAVSAWAIWRVATAPGVGYKPLWIFGSLFGFVGFATTFSSPGDLSFHFGVQIPVLLLLKVGGGEVLLKAMFPLVAAVALVRFRSSSDRPDK